MLPVTATTGDIKPATVGRGQPVPRLQGVIHHDEASLVHLLPMAHGLEHGLGDERGHGPCVQGRSDELVAVKAPAHQGHVEKARLQRARIRAHAGQAFGDQAGLKAAAMA